VIALHGPKSGEEVLDDPSHDMADVGLVVGCGRPLEEDEVLAFTGLFQTLLEDLLVPPLTQDLLLECREGIA
jgi:hypothetical protein